MGFKFACPVCSQHLEAEESWVGLEAECPRCAKMLVVPAVAHGDAGVEVAAEKHPETPRETRDLATADTQQDQASAEIVLPGTVRAAGSNPLTFWAWFRLGNVDPAACAKAIRAWAQSRAAAGAPICYAENGSTAVEVGPHQWAGTDEGFFISGLQMVLQMKGRDPNRLYYRDDVAIYPKDEADPPSSVAPMAPNQPLSAPVLPRPDEQAAAGDRVEPTQGRSSELADGQSPVGTSPTTGGSTSREPVPRNRSATEPAHDTQSHDVPETASKMVRQTVRARRRTKAQ